jgi:hypothetical protein
MTEKGNRNPYPDGLIETAEGLEPASTFLVSNPEAERMVEVLEKRMKIIE